jgi:hypothetical protein
MIAIVTAPTKGKKDRIMSKNRLSLFSIAISLTCIIAVIITNYNISICYLASDGKTQALFGLIEITNFYYKYYFLTLCFLSFLFLLFAKRRNEKKPIIWTALIFSFLSIISIFIELWEFMI